MASTGRIFVIGDDIDTDQLAPGQFMKAGIDQLAKHCLASVRPEFSESVSAGDFLVAGRNFGLGSSREQAAEALKHLGIQAVIAQSFGGIFYRNAINLGLPALVVLNSDIIRDGDRAQLDMKHAQLFIADPQVPCKTTTVQLQPIPPNIQQILSDGGLVPHLKKRFDRI